LEKKLEKLLSIGKILNFHGIHGEVKVGFTAGKEEQLAERKQMYIVKGSEIIPLTVESIRFHKKYALIKFREISSINEAVEFKGAYLKVAKEEIEEYLEEDEFYVDDLIGLDAFDTDGLLLGKVTSIAKMGGQDLLVIKGSQEKEHLVPFVQALVPDINIQNKKIIIKNIPGLI